MRRFPGDEEAYKEENVIRKVRVRTIAAIWVQLFGENQEENVLSLL